MKTFRWGWWNTLSLDCGSDNCSVAQSCLTLYDPMDCSPPGSSVHGISRARLLEWVAISFSWGSSQPKDQTCVSTLAKLFFTTEPPGKPAVLISRCMCMHAQLLQPCPTLWDPVTVAHQAPLSMGFSRQEYWSGLPCPPPGDLPDPGAEPTSLTSPALVGRFFTTSATWENHQLYVFVCICHQ